ncbi:MAG: hypothetical protein ACLFVK_05875 [Dehalococcoidia bacterium]
MLIRRRIVVVSMITVLIAALMSTTVGAASLVPGVGQAQVALTAESDEPRVENSIHADGQRLEQVKELWGKDIIWGRFIRQVAPEIFEGVSQRMIAQASVSTLYWPAINNGLKVENLSDVDICWGYINNEEVEWLWVWLGSEEKEIEPTTLSSLHPKVRATDEHPCKEVTVTFNEAGKPTIHPVTDVPLEALEAEWQEWESNGVTRGAETEKSPLHSRRIDSMRDDIGTFYAKAWWESSGGILITGEEAWQTCIWDGSDITGVNSVGGSYYLYEPFWEHTSGYYQDLGPTPPCNKHTSYAEGHFRSCPLHSYVHEIDVWSYAFGDGHPDGACNFSGSGPPGASQKHRYYRVS